MKRPPPFLAGLAKVASPPAPRDGSDRSNVQTIGTIEEDNAHNLTAAASHSNVRRAAEGEEEEEEEKTD